MQKVKRGDWVRIESGIDAGYMGLVQEVSDGTALVAFDRGGWIDYDQEGDGDMPYEKVYDLEDLTVVGPVKKGSLSDIVFGQIKEMDCQAPNAKLNTVRRAPELKNKKFSVCVKDGDSVKKVGFGDPDMAIRKSDDDARKNFRSRHNCDDPGPKTKARYWACKTWEKDFDLP
jgi:hypothetical protein